MELIVFIFGMTIAFISLYLTRNPEHRRAVLARLNIGKKVVEGKTSPTKALDPEKQAQDLPAYEDIFPPDRRGAFADLKRNALNGSGKSTKELAETEPDYSKCVPDKDVCNGDDKLDHVTPTGFTVEEIRRLGDFPDYATLSGIPLPSAYKEFDIKTALPRPYRPLRWPYHQTMCKMN